MCTIPIIPGYPARGPNQILDNRNFGPSILGQIAFRTRVVCWSYKPHIGLHEQREKDRVGRCLDIAAILGSLDQQLGRLQPSVPFLIAIRQREDQPPRVGERRELLAVAQRDRP